MKKEYIKWWDHSSWGNAGWHHIEQDMDLTPEVIRSIGFVTKETEDYLILTPFVSTTGAVQGSICILKSCIQKRRKIK